MIEKKMLIVFLIIISLFLSGCVNKESAKPMHFGAQLTFASGDMFITIQELKEQLKVIEETGTDVIRIDIDYEAWMTNDQNNIKRHDDIINQIRSDGMKLMLADRGATSFTKNKVTWKYFQEQHLKHTRIFMERYKPDYYVVIKEPIWYREFFPMFSTETTPSMWNELAAKACSIVKEVNAETKCAVAVYPSGRQEKEFFKLASNISNLDIMGVDVYDENDLQISTNELLQLVPPAKEIWMLESWNGGGSSYLQPWKESDDAKWINRSVIFSRDHNFKGYIVYYPLHFSSYSKLRDVDWTQRTSAFYSYKNIIKVINGNGKP